MAIIAPKNNVYYQMMQVADVHIINIDGLCLSRIKNMRPTPSIMMNFCLEHVTLNQV